MQFSENYSGGHEGSQVGKALLACNLNGGIIDIAFDNAMDLLTPAGFVHETRPSTTLHVDGIVSASMLIV